MDVKKSGKLLRTGSVKLVLKRFTKFVKNKEESDHLPGGDVPKRHFVVYVGENRSRHIVPISCLSHPEFQALLQKSEDEFGFKQEMGLTIPCDEVVFLSITLMIIYINQKDFIGLLQSESLPGLVWNFKDHFLLFVNHMHLLRLP
ncbi:hypothetical protein LWI28_009444 [Acer negundo]|uniref:Small auxin up regulated protein n=1 Tax=Acer negundo TaxID=4023 RepID=A0AAD5NJX5_ACENE|nr:hypothetical protein LWI28_009444 [Acer negundo]